MAGKRTVVQCPTEYYSWGRAGVLLSAETERRAARTGCCLMHHSLEVKTSLNGSEEEDDCIWDDNPHINWSVVGRLC